MATGVIRRQRDDRCDKVFFSGMAVVILISVFVVFARTYYLAGLFKAPLPNLLDPFADRANLLGRSRRPR